MKKNLLKKVITGALLITTILGSSVSASSAWISSNGKWTYTQTDGTLAKGWKQIYNTWYYFEQDGIMKVGWLSDAGHWYYLNNTGAMATGWISYNGKSYYLNSKGDMAENTITPDGYYVDATGAWDGQPIHSNSNNGTNGEGLTYTWEEVKNRLLNAGLGTSLFTGTVVLNNEYSNDLYKGVDMTYLVYNPSPYKRTDEFDVFHMNSLKMKDIPYMDFGMMITIYDIEDYNRIVPGFTQQYQKVMSDVCEAAFPGQGAKFDAMTNDYSIRTTNNDSTKIGTLKVDLPTVYFFGGRRIYITPRRNGTTTVEFSAINDTSDIWTEVYKLAGINPTFISIDDMKKYMPELKDY